MAVTAIGDVHGCSETLKALIEKLSPTREDHLLFIGDYTDRGPNSKAVIDQLIELEEAAERGDGPQCTFLRGNHDQMMLDCVGDGAIASEDDYTLWLRNGGRTTLNSYRTENGIEIPHDHIDFLQRTRLYWENKQFVYVHAGLRTQLSVAENLAHPDPFTFLWTRDHTDQREFPKWEKTVVCGHTPVTEPVNLPRLINIDTGAVFAPRRTDLGRLTAVRLPEREFVTVFYRD